MLKIPFGSDEKTQATRCHWTTAILIHWLDATATSA